METESTTDVVMTVYWPSPHDSGIGMEEDCTPSAASPNSSLSSLSPPSTPSKRPHSSLSPSTSTVCLRQQKVRKMSSSSIVCTEMETALDEKSSTNQTTNAELLEHCQMTPSTSAYSPACLGATSSASSSSSSLFNEPSPSSTQTSTVCLHDTFTQSGQLSEDDEAKLSLSCHWGNCLQLRNDKNALYDHVVEDHIKHPIPLESRIKKSTSSESTTLDSDATDGEDGEEVDEQTCQWKDCHMRLKRGNISKKTAWLEEHFRTRHSFGALPFRCLLTNCIARFATGRQLDEHVRKSHFDYAAKFGVAASPAAVTKPKEKEEELRGLRWEPEPMPSLWVRHHPYSVDDYVVQKIHDRMQAACVLRFDVGFVPIKYEKLKGAAKRKAPTEQHFYITSAARTASPEKPTCDLSGIVDSINRYPTMEELFAEWKGKNAEEGTSTMTY